MIMFFLPWWTYVLLGTVTFTCALLGQWLANLAQLGVEHDDGPFPCGEHLGTDEDGAEDWCWQLAGHDGDHLGMRQEWPDESWAGPAVYEDEGFRQTDAAGNLVIDENPGYLPDSAPLPELLQRLSKVPTQTEHNDPWPVCHSTSTEGACHLVQAHLGPHDYV